MRILHLADVHLDTAFTGRSPAIRSRLRQATREAFRAAVQLALDERVHAVLIAGDLFDSDRLSFETERFLVAELKRLLDAGIAVVYCTGNHDPGSISTTRRAIPWPSGIHLMDSAEPQVVEICDRDGHPVGSVTAAGHETGVEERDLAATYPDPGSGPHANLPRVAMLHTQVTGSRTAERHHRYAPAALDTLTGAGYDYWALGHIHQREVLSEFPGVCYPGNLQGRSPRETGPKGAVLVEVRRGLPPAMEFRSLAEVRWETLELRDVPGQSPDALVGAVEARWRPLRSADVGGGVQWMVRVRIGGTTPLWRELRSEEDVTWLREELTERLGALQVDLRVEDVHAPVSVTDFEDREDVLGEAIRLVRALGAGREELAGLAEELHGPGEQDLAAYLAEILASAPAELVSRMRVPGDDA